MRSSLIGSLVQRAALQPRAQAHRAFAYSRSAACIIRDASIADGDDAVAGIAQPVRWPPGLRLPRHSSGAVPERTVDFFDVKGDLEALLAPLGCASCRRSIRRCTRGAAPDRSWTAAHRLTSANFTRVAPGLRAAARAGAVRSGPRCRAAQRELPAFEPIRASTGVQRDLAWWCRSGRPRRGAGRACSMTRRAGAPRHAVRHLQARPPRRDRRR